MTPSFPREAYNSVVPPTSTSVLDPAVAAYLNSPKGSYVKTLVNLGRDGYQFLCCPLFGAGGGLIGGTLTAPLGGIGAIPGAIAGCAVGAAVGLLNPLDPC